MLATRPRRPSSPRTPRRSPITVDRRRRRRPGARRRHALPQPTAAHADRRGRSPASVPRTGRWPSRETPSPLSASCPSHVRRDVPGFVWNRLQFALVRECAWLVENGVATPEDVDTVMREGLARRWRRVGPLRAIMLGGIDTWNRSGANIVPELSNASRPSRPRARSRSTAATSPPTLPPATRPSPASCAPSGHGRPS